MTRSRENGIFEVEAVIWMEIGMSGRVLVAKTNRDGYVTSKPGLTQRFCPQINNI